MRDSVTNKFWVTINQLNQPRNILSSKVQEQDWATYKALKFKTRHHTPEQAQTLQDILSHSQTHKVSTQSTCINITDDNPDLPKDPSSNNFPYLADAIKSVINKSKKDSAPGPNGIPQTVFKYDPAFWSAHLENLLAKVELSNRIPDSWQGTILTPIYKGGGAIDRTTDLLRCRTSNQNT